MQRAASFLPDFLRRKPIFYVFSVFSFKGFSIISKSFLKSTVFAVYSKQSHIEFV